MPRIPTSSLVRGAKLAALPASYATRKAVGAGMRLGGRPAEIVADEVQRRSIEQLCRTLGELKGGAMKLGQALSVFEALLPEELAAPYRATLNGLQNAAPPLPRSAVERVLVESLGPSWEEMLSIEWTPRGAASIGQVHQGTWLSTGEAAAVKIQYPGVGKALRSDLRQLARMGWVFSRVVPGANVTGLIEELTVRLVEELDYTLEASRQQRFAEAFVGDPLIFVPEVLHASEHVLVSQWVEGEALGARITDPELRSDERDRIGLQLAHSIYSGPERVGLLHADPHPGNFLILPDGRLGVLDFGAVKELPGGIPEPLGRAAALVLHGRGAELRETMVGLGFLPEDAPVSAEDLCDYLHAMSEPFGVEAFHFTRRWLRAEAVKLANPRSSQHVAPQHLTLPPEYLMVHRVATGVTGLLCQLDAHVPLRALELRWSPGFREAVAAHTGRDEEDLLDEAEAVLRERLLAYGLNPEAYS